MNALSNYQIKNFFQKHRPITDQACHDKAVAIAGGGVAAPTAGQGAQSYTVRVSHHDSPEKLIVQFRDPRYPLDVNLVLAAQEAYGQLVPSCRYLEGQLDPLHVYTMNDVSGVGFDVARDDLLLPKNYHLLEQTIRGFAVFCSSAWHSQTVSVPRSDIVSIQRKYTSHLERLSTKLPDRFRPQLNALKTQLPSLFSGDFPMVINHWDLLENNIHVDMQTGSITGIVDWRDAEMGPFGTQFWGLENLLGVRTGNGMRFHQRHVELRRLFWETLYAKMGGVPEDVRAAIRAARMIGIYFANDDFDDKFPVEEGTRELAVLESVTLSLEDAHLETLSRSRNFYSLRPVSLGVVTVLPCCWNVGEMAKYKINDNLIMGAASLITGTRVTCSTAPVGVYSNSYYVVKYVIRVSL